MMEQSPAEAISLDGPAFLEVWNCSVVVINFVNYPEAVEEVPARELALWLHCMYCKLDAVVKKHQAHKLSTSQELYTAVFGELEEQDTAEAAVGLASELVETVKQMNLPSGAPLSCRIAVSCGKAAAAVTGTTAWTFQLYGKTLEKAKAVVQSGPTGVVQLTAEVMWHLGFADAAMYRLHRMQPDFGGMAVYTQTFGDGQPSGVLLAVLAKYASAVQQMVVGVTRVAAKPALWARSAIQRTQFPTAHMEEQFCSAWNAKLYHQDLWALAVVVPLSMVACLSISSTMESTASNTLAMWLLMLLSMGLGVLWSYFPTFYIRHRTALVSSYRAARAFLFFLCRWHLPVAATQSSQLPLLIRTCVPNNSLIFSCLAVGLQVPLLWQMLLQVLTWLMMLLQQTAVCKQANNGRLLNCIKLSSQVAPDIGLMISALLSLALCYAFENTARIAFMRAHRKGVEGKKAL